MSGYGDILWQASESRRKASRMTAFAQFAGERVKQDLSSYEALHRWSVTDLDAFWQAVADFCEIVWSKPAPHAYLAPPAKEGLRTRVRGAKFFPEAALNFAENLLPKASSREVLVAYAEGAERRALSADELRDAVARCASSLCQVGVGKGDRVAGVLINGPEAVVAMLATAALGGVWSSCSPDFGANAIAERLSQVEPKVLFFTSAYIYSGKRFDCHATMKDALERLPSVKVAVAVAHLEASAEKTTGSENAATDLGSVQVDSSQSYSPGSCSWQSYGDFLQRHAAMPALDFTAVGFDDPLYILFSSGTTGVPKCITHGVGGTLLQHKKELLLHSDLGDGDRLFYYTTCGWMMWNWMVSGLATGASLVLFDGAVASPDIGGLWRIVREERVTHFGTSPKFIAANAAAGFSPKSILEGSQLRTLLSTGSPLLPEQFAWVYKHVGGDLHLASISGGTDIVSCFMLGTPLLPVRAGEIQYAGLGMAVEAWDEQAKPVHGCKGELVCTQPFISMPIKFWNDPDGSKYDKAYFGYYLDQGLEVWRHGDYIEVQPHGGIIVHGRSDATLNPGGVRIGTAEIYRQVEAMPEVLDSLAIGRRDDEGDTQIVLFVKLRPDCEMSDELRTRMKQMIRKALTPRHVPREIIAVKDIPYTRSGKKVEIAVTQAIHGEQVQNMAALSNPEAMDEYFAMSR